MSQALAPPSTSNQLALCKEAARPQPNCGRAPPALAPVCALQLAFMPPEAFGDDAERLCDELDVYSLGICGEQDCQGCAGLGPAGCCHRTTVGHPARSTPVPLVCIAAGAHSFVALLPLALVLFNTTSVGLLSAPTPLQSTVCAVAGSRPTPASPPTSSWLARFGRHSCWHRERRWGS